MRGFSGENLSTAIRPMRASDAEAVARLHEIGIPTGFLSSLGTGFLKELYRAIPSSSCGMGFVLDLGEPLAFVAVTTNTGCLYREVLKGSGLVLCQTLVTRLWRPSVVRKCFETLLYPNTVGADLPSAEVLSVAVHERARGNGIGKALMKRAMAALRAEGVERVKVACLPANRAAVGLYTSCGFQLAEESEHHGLPVALYVAGIAPKPGETYEPTDTEVVQPV